MDDTQDGKNLTAAEVAKLLGTTDRTIRGWLTKFHSDDVLYEDRGGHRVAVVSPDLLAKLRRRKEGPEQAQAGRRAERQAETSGGTVRDNSSSFRSVPSAFSASAVSVPGGGRNGFHPSGLLPSESQAEQAENSEPFVLLPSVPTAQDELIAELRRQIEEAKQEKQRALDKAEAVQQLRDKESSEFRRLLALQLDEFKDSREQLKERYLLPSLPIEQEKPRVKKNGGNGNIGNGSGLVELTIER